MKPKMSKTRFGLTLIELVVALAVSTIIILGLGAVLADNQRGWSNMYNRNYSNAAVDKYIAKKGFEAIVRKASSKTVLLDSASHWVEVYYYGSSNSAGVDRYARFYLSGNQLKADYGSWNTGQSNPRTLIRTLTLCSNVTSCIFKAAGQSVQMMLTVNDGSQTAYVTSSAVMHNL